LEVERAETLVEKSRKGTAEGKEKGEIGVLQSGRSQASGGGGAVLRKQGEVEPHRIGGRHRSERKKCNEREVGGEWEERKMGS